MIYRQRNGVPDPILAVREAVLGPEYLSKEEVYFCKRLCEDFHFSLIPISSSI